MRQWIRRCNLCTNEYHYKRSTSKFCSAKCRVGYHKRGAEAHQLMQDIEDHIVRVIALVDLVPRAIDFSQLLEQSAHLVVITYSLDMEILRVSQKELAQHMLIKR